MKDRQLKAQYILGKLRRQYFMSLPETEEDMKKSRTRFAIGEASSGAVDQIAGGVFIVLLMSYVGISDANIGMLTSLAALAAIVQIISISYVKRLKKSKLFVCLVVLQRAWLGIMFLVPLLNISNHLKVIFIIGCYLYSKTSVQVGSSSIQEWVASLVPVSLRGKYFALKDIINVIVMAIALLLVGWVVDLFRAADQMTGAFLFIGIFIILLSLLSFSYFSWVKEPKLAMLNSQGKEIHGSLAKKADKSLGDLLEKENLFEECKVAFKMSNFKKYFILECLWIITFFISSPFNPSYSIKELGLSYTFISIIAFVSSIVRIILTSQMGKISDKYGMARTLKITILSLGIHFLVWSFTTPSNAMLMYIISSAFATVAWSFIPIGIFNVKLEWISYDKRVVQFAILSSITGTLGFLMSVVSGKLLDALQKKPLYFAGDIVYAQQLLNFLGLIASIVTCLYIHFVLQKEKPAVDTKDGMLV